MENLYDICIIGGGAAGCAAAYIASKSGLKTALIEKNNFLGGLMTGGLVVPVMKTNDENINIEFYTDLVSNLADVGGEIEYFDKNNGWFNPELLKIILDKMLKDKGVDVFFEMEPKKVHESNSMIEFIEFGSNLLSLSIYSKYFVDATGDAAIFKMLNEKFYEQEKEKQACSLRFTMSGVNLEKLKNFLIKTDSNKEVTNWCEVNGCIHLTTAYTWDDKNWGLKPIFEKALNEGALKPFDTAYFQIFTVAGMPDTIAFNCPRLRNFNEKCPKDYSNAIIEAREAILRLLNFVKKYFEGFENAYISNIAPITGKRETNKIIAKKQYTIDEMLSSKPNEPILCGDYPVDIHSNKKDDSILKNCGKYYLGIDSLISKNYDNLYAAGRNFGGDNKTQAALRTQKTCMSMGEGVSKHIYKILNFIN